MHRFWVVELPSPDIGTQLGYNPKTVQVWEIALFSSKTFFEIAGAALKNVDFSL